ncbi:MAG: hypothetical protein ABI972_10045 [Acidobacteriota bacterium]
MAIKNSIALCLLSCAGLAAQQPMSCRLVETAPSAIRAEGLSELLSDVLIACTGGSPLTAGTVPQYQLLIVSSAPLNPRVVPPPKPDPIPILDGPLQSPSTLTDILAVVDEPLASEQRPCVPAAPATYCAVDTRAAATGPNVFQGSMLQDNVVLFSKLPVNPPGEGKTRLIRVTNLRASAGKIPKLPDPDRITLSAQLFDSAGREVAIQNNSQLSGVAKPGIVAAIRTIDDEEVGPNTPALVVTPALLPQGRPGKEQAFLVKFTEGFASAFKRRNLGTTSADPGYVLTQADPGGPANTESGFYNASFPSTNALDQAGLADSGTRLKVVLTQIPENVHVWASARDSETGTTGYSAASPRALLTYAEKLGGGPFAKNNPEFGTFSLFFPENGSVTLVWEVMAANASAIENLSFEIRLLAPNGVPRLGTAYIHAGPAPIPGGTKQTGEPSAPTVPAFVESPDDPVPAFRILPTLSSTPATAVSAASLSGTAVAPDSLVTLFGSGLSAVTATSGAAPVTPLAEVTVDVIDNSGTRRTAPLLMVSPTQINLLVNPDTAIGQAALIVRNGTREVATGALRVNTIAPGLFSASGSGTGVAVGQAVTVSEGGARSADLSRYDAELKRWESVPVELVPASGAFLRLYGTGIRGAANLAAVSLRVGEQSVPVTRAGPSGTAGIDLIEAGPLPQSLSGKGEVPVILTVEGKAANSLTIFIK